MSHLFGETVNDWEDWGRVFQSIPAFTPLIKEIFRREDLPFVPLSPLTPGTNAVFRAGDKVVKVFFPKESGLDPEPDFLRERDVSLWLAARGCPIPRVLGHGRIEDKYGFFYILTEFFPEPEAGDWLKTARPQEKQRLGQALWEILGRLAREDPPPLPLTDLRANAFRSPRFQRLPSALQEDLRERAGKADISSPVLTHGDLTGENLLIRKGGEPILIDWADACLAPGWYEYPPLVFELCRGDRDLLSALGGEDREAFVEQILDGLSLHPFAPELLLTAAQRQGRPPFRRLGEVKELLKTWIL